MDHHAELAAFVQAARDRSFSAAARHLDLTPSAVSKLVSRLENRLEVRLFTRQARAVLLTEEGQSYLPTAQAAVDAMAAALEHGTALRDTISGTLRIHTMLTFARHQVVPWLPEFLQRYPNLKVDLMIGPQYVDVFDDGVDIAIHSGPLPDSTLIARTIAASRWITCASPSYLAKRGIPRHPQDLSSHSCIGFTFKSDWNVWPFTNPMAEAIHVRPAYAITTTQG
ncbi:LysR substrate-binding domain-containing protein, partial [Bordetella muralis]|uniref:LysR substrate-binding domain-containing protein n=1 Tax=Bordetella muralis TaxID=1649130 RepID=UPI0039EE6ACB